MEINTNPNYLNNVQNQNAQGANSATAENVERFLFENLINADTNGDNMLTAEEIAAAGINIANYEKYKVPNDDDVKNEALNGNKTDETHPFEDLINADTNGDNMLTAEEIAAAGIDIANYEKYKVPNDDDVKNEALNGNKNIKFLNLINADTNRDNKLTIEEIIAAGINIADYAEFLVESNDNKKEIV